MTQSWWLQFCNNCWILQCFFLCVCDCGCCYSPLQSLKILSLVSFTALAALLRNIHHFSQETNTAICMSTILQFSLKGVFQSWGINTKIWGQGFLLSCLWWEMLFATGGSNQLGRTNHLSGTEHFISFFLFFFFFCDTNTEDLTSPWIRTEQGTSCLYAPELWKLPRESHAVPSQCVLGLVHIPPIYRQF